MAYYHDIRTSSKARLILIHLIGLYIGLSLRMNPYTEDLNDHEIKLRTELRKIRGALYGSLLADVRRHKGMKKTRERKVRDRIEWIKRGRPKPGE